MVQVFKSLFPSRRRRNETLTSCAASPIKRQGLRLVTSTPTPGNPFTLIVLVFAALIRSLFTANAVDYIAFCGPVAVDTRRADLQVASLDTALQAGVASTQPVAWTVANFGGKPVTNGWVDRVYLSTNALVDSGRLLGEFPASAPLATNQSLARIQNITLPADLEPDRDYWWIVVTDAGNAINELNEVNNTYVSDHPCACCARPPPTCEWLR